MSNHQDKEVFTSESLASVKSYQELTKEEQEVVLKELGSPEAYMNLRTLVLATRATFAEEHEALQPSKSIQADLLRRVASRKPSSAISQIPTAVKKFFTYRVPAYQAVTAMLVLLTAVIVYHRDDIATGISAHDRIVYLPTIDTQYVAADTQALIHRVADSLREIFMLKTKSEGTATDGRSSEYRAAMDTGRYDTAISDENSMAQAIQAGEPENIFVGLRNFSAVREERRGRSLLDDSSYARFLMTAPQDTF